jgi:hypothetical protein
MPVGLRSLPVRNMRDTLEEATDPILMIDAYTRCVALSDEACLTRAAARRLCVGTAATGTGRSCRTGVWAPSRRPDSGGKPK